MIEDLDDYVWAAFDLSVRSELGFPDLIGFACDYDDLRSTVRLSRSTIVTKVFYRDLDDLDLILNSSDMCWRRSFAYQFII